ncbi:MAG: DinB family protein [Aurantibacter sp.]
MNNLYLPALVERAALIPGQFHDSFGDLAPSQFNWKPQAKQWSVGECVAHLIATNNCYFPLINRITEGKHKNSTISRIPGLSRMWGKMLLRMVSPEIKKKVKTLKPFEPDTSDISIRLLDNFEQLQLELIALFKKSDRVDHEKTIITSPASKLITYSLKDTLNILIDHEQRHYNQALAVLARSEFPA